MNLNTKYISITTKKQWEAFYRKPIVDIYSLYIDNRNADFLIDYDVIRKCHNCYYLSIYDRNEGFRDLHCLAGCEFGSLTVYSPSLTLEGVSAFSHNLETLTFLTAADETDLSEVEALHFVTALEVSAPGAKRLDAIRNLPLDILSLNVGLECISTLSSFKCLRGKCMTGLNLEGNAIEDVSPLRSLKVDNISLSKNKIQDISPITEMVQNCLTKGISPWDGFTLDLRGNPIRKKD